MEKPIPAKIEKRILRLASAWSDLKAAGEAFLFLQRSTGAARYHFFLSMIMCYGRPFTENHGIGSLLDEYPNFPDFDDDEMNCRHQRMMDIRNSFGGHSAIFGSRIKLLAPFAVDPETGAMGAPPFGFLISRRSFDEKEDYSVWLHEVVPPLFARVDSDLSELNTKTGRKYLGKAEVRELETRQDDFIWNLPKKRRRG